ncbi:MAG TPA: CHASE2 domain-containing protein [Bryobacteraceae bacterium]|nr:CHASE2 domain-containing protein [Bryobacteraceae bacterium]
MKSKSWLASRSKRIAAYIAVIAVCFAIAMLAAWPGVSPAARRIDHYAYDLLLTRQAPEAWEPQSVVVAIDERTLNARGSMRNVRLILAEALDEIAKAKPKAVALDVTLPDATEPDVDARLEAALRATPNLVLPCQSVIAGNAKKWEDPLPRFRTLARAVGHVDHKRDQDGVNREIPLEELEGNDQRWALALQAFRVARGEEIVESPEDVEIGELAIPAPRSEEGRPMLIRYLPAGIPSVSVMDLRQSQNQLRGKTVFVGVTALSAAYDRLVNPYMQEVPGVSVHAQAYETLARAKFLTPVRQFLVPVLCGLIAIATGLIFSLRFGWQAWVLAVLLLIAAHTIPVLFFRRDIVFPYFAPAAVAWLCTVGAASFQYLFVQRQLGRSESERSRYQQALHWAAHEMRTPLTAIQGSSEIMTRYTLPEAKRQQLSEMINSESKRLARMIQTFLDVERLADGQMEMKRETFAAASVVETCLKRAAPIGERKNISIFLDGSVDGTLTGDRELMEYALYNLLTNAVKYSPEGTEVRVAADVQGADLRLSVRDQGIGMDAKELRNIFKKFYRTKRAEASGETGTGIGLSIVEQIVNHHGGRIEVTSEPGKGSCFTIIIAASVSAAASHNAETSDRRG